MKLNKLFILITLFISAVALQPATATETPLMVIRFNQEIVEYEKSLEKAANAAIAIKPATFFDIVSIVPETGDRKSDKKFKNNSNYFSDQIAEKIKSLGVTEDKIRISSQSSKLIKANEVQIFVR